MSEKFNYPTCPLYNSIHKEKKSTISGITGWNRIAAAKFFCLITSKLKEGFLPLKTPPHPETILPCITSHHKMVGVISHLPP